MGNMKPDEAWWWVGKFDNSRRVHDQQRVREQQLVRAMRADNEADRKHRAGVIALENGNLAGLFDSVLRPTPEQMAHGEFQSYQSDTEANTAVSITTLRRVLIPHVLRLYGRGLIDQDQLKIVGWYRNTHDKTGLTGNIPSTDYLKEVFASPAARLPFSESQCEAQDEIRFVRKFMDGAYIRFFDAVVLDDLPFSKAKEWARCRNGKEGGIFKGMVVQLCEAYKELKK